MITHIYLSCLSPSPIFNAMAETSLLTSPTSASTYQDPRDLGTSVDASEIPAVDGDPTVNLFHNLLGHLPSGRFETRPDCKAFISELFRTRGIDLSLNLGFGTKLPDEAGDCTCISNLLVHPQLMLPSTHKASRTWNHGGGLRHWFH